MALTTIDDRGLKTPIDLLDNEKIRFGTGNDLEIWHSGSQSYIRDSGTGTLRIEGSEVGILNADGSETMAQFVSDGAVSLRYDNVTTFETKSNGVIVQGAEGQNAELLLYADEGDDNADKWRLKVDTNGQLEISNYASGSYEKNIECNGNGNVELYYDNVKQINTTSTGVGLGDSKRIDFGDGADLQIFHDGTGCNIRSTSSKLEIRSDDLLLQDSAAEKYFRGVSDGAVELYYDNSEKIRTTSSGLRIPDATYLYFGTDEDMWMGHNGSHGYIKNGTGNLNLRTGGTLWVDNAGGTETYIKAVENGTVELYYDNSKKLHTHSGGITVSGSVHMDDNNKYYCGSSDDLEIYHDGSHSYIKDAGTGYLILKGSEIQLQSTTGEDLAKFVPDGATELYYDNVKHFETNSGGCKVNDSKYVGFGNGNDLTIYHDGSDSVINNNTGNLYINAKTGEAGIKIMPDDSTLLYFNGSERLTTTSSGITVTGSCTGCDFNFSNMNPENTPANEVDGTRGSWTLQEGIEDLFLINRLSGKKYKFNLTEVS